MKETGLFGRRVLGINKQTNFNVRVQDRKSD